MCVCVCVCVCVSWLPDGPGLTESRDINRRQCSQPSPPRPIPPFDPHSRPSDGRSEDPPGSPGGGAEAHPFGFLSSGSLQLQRPGFELRLRQIVSYRQGPNEGSVSSEGQSQPPKRTPVRYAIAEEPQYLVVTYDMVRALPRHGPRGTQVG